MVSIRLIPKRLSDSIFPQFPISPDHPLFTLEPPLVRKLLTRNELRRQVLRNILIAFGMIVILWVVADHPNTAKRFPGDWELTQGQSLLVLGGFIAGWLVNIACFMVTADSFRFVHQNLARWELIRITPISSDELARVKHASAVARVQRVAAGVFGLRLGIAIMVILDWSLSGGLRDYSGNIFYGLALIIFVTLVTILYAFDPLWRAKLLTVHNLIESARNPNVVSFTLWTGIAMIAVFIRITVLVIGCMGVAIFGLSVASGRDAYFPLSLFLLLLSVLFAQWIYNFYEDGYKDSLHELADRLERI